MTAAQDLIASIRQQFPILNQAINNQPLVYFDNAATTQKPHCVLDAVERYYASTNANVHRASHHLSSKATALFEQARESVANYINAPASREVIWTRGATEAINLVAYSWGSRLREGDEIIVSAMEHHANIVPWQLLAQRTGVTLKVIPVNSQGELDLAGYTALLSNKTRLVAVTHVSNALGTINPIEQITSLAHAVGALVLVDGAQALPHFDIDVQKLDADFYVFSGHKTYAPTGIGVLYGKTAILEDMPPWQSGGEMIQHVSFAGTRFNSIPFKFEAGTPHIAGALGLAEALKWLGRQPLEQLAIHEQNLFQAALDGCSTIKGFRRTGSPSEHVSLLSFTHEAVHPQDIGLLLDRKGIAIRTGHHCTMPLMESLGLNGTARASFAFYNTLDEVNHFVAALDEIVRPLSLTTTAHQIATIQETAANYIRDLLQLQGWNARYRQIMLYGKNHPGLDKYEKSEEHLIPGCESRTWLTASKDSAGRYQFRADSDARIIRGLIAVVLSALNNKTAAEIKNINIDMIFDQLELQQHLSPSRGNGLRAVIEKIDQIVNQDLS